METSTMNTRKQFSQPTSQSRKSRPAASPIPYLGQRSQQRPPLPDTSSQQFSGTEYVAAGAEDVLALPVVGPRKSHDKRTREDLGSEEDGPAAGLYSDFSDDDQDGVEIAERRAAGKRGRKRAAPSAHTRTLRLNKYGPAGPLVYESLQTNVCVELVRTRYVLLSVVAYLDRKILTERQVELINEVLVPAGLHTNSRIMIEAIESVRDWVGNKSCRLRKYFVSQGELR